MRVSRTKDCYCHTCKREFHYLGITRHRAAHRDRFEDCKITFTYGDTYTYRYSEKKAASVKPAASAGGLAQR